MKKRIFGKAATALIFVGVFSIGAFAATAAQEIKAQLRPDISVVIDGQKQSFKDAKGNTVYPILYNGTTYLPLRAIGGLMGKEVSWDGNTNTATLKSSSSNIGTTILDKDGIKITFNGIEKNDSFLGGYSAKVTIVNNTAKNITVQSRDESVNGIMCAGLFSCDIAAGKTAIDKILFSKSSLDKIMVTKIENIELVFNIFESESWDDIFNSDIIKLNP